MSAGCAVVAFGWFSFFWLAHHLKNKAACDGCRLIETRFNATAKTVRISRLYADKRAVFFVITEILISEAARRDEAICACFVQRNEQSKFRDACNARKIP